LDVGALSADERRLVLENAVVLSFADGNQTMDEVVLLQSLARRLEIPEDEARQIFRVQANRSNSLLALLKSKDGAGEAT
jgi:hypothetical protein